MNEKKKVNSLQTVIETVSFPSKENNSENIVSKSYDSDEVLMDFQLQI